MNIFTANQVNQVYVLTKDSTVVDGKLTKTNTLGSVGVGHTPDNESIYFMHIGAGGLTRSDLIDVKNISYVKTASAKSMARNLVTAKVTVNPEALDNSKPVIGQDYVLTIKFQNPMGMSPDNQYFKHGVVHATANLTVSDFYLKLASSISKNMSREAVELVKVYVTNGGTETEITASDNVSDTAKFNGTYDGLLIKEVEQDWILGIKQQKPLVFTVQPSCIVSEGEDIMWGDVIYSYGKKVVGGSYPTEEVTADTPKEAGTVVNSKLMADYEYFYMGERGDQYRMVGWPDYVPTTYLVDATNKFGYDTVAIHYSYTGSNHAVQKSEKDITFIVPRTKEDTTGEVDTLAKTLVDKIKGLID